MKRARMRERQPPRNPRLGYASRMSEGGRRDRVLALVQELSGNGRRELAPGMRLAEIGIDSLAWAELGAAVERELGLDLSGLDVGTALGRPRSGPG
jgi:acyl carrier protein